MTRAGQIYSIDPVANAQLQALFRRVAKLEYALQEQPQGNAPAPAALGIVQTFTAGEQTMTIRPAATDDGAELDDSGDSDITIYVAYDGDTTDLNYQADDIVVYIPFGGEDSAGNWGILLNGREGPDDTDELVAVSSTDETPDYLNNKISNTSTKSGNDITVYKEKVEVQDPEQPVDEELDFFIKATDLPDATVGTTQSITGDGSAGDLIHLNGDRDLPTSGNELFYGISPTERKFFDSLPLKDTATKGVNDITVYAEQVGTAPNQELQLFILATSISDTDELFKVSSNDTAAGYFEDKINNSATQSGGDITVRYEVQNEGNNETVDFFILASDLPTSTDEKVGAISTDTTPGYLDDKLLFPGTKEPGDINVQYEVFNATGDAAIGFFIEPEDLPGTVKVSSNDTTADYLENQIANASGVIQNLLDLDIRYELNGEGANEAMDFFVDMSGVTDYNASNLQVLVHDQGTTKYMDTIDLSDITGFGANKALETSGLSVIQWV